MGAAPVVGGIVECLQLSRAGRVCEEWVKYVPINKPMSLIVMLHNYAHKGGFLPARAPAPSVPTIFAKRTAGGSSVPEEGLVDISAGFLHEIPLGEIVSNL